MRWMLAVLFIVLGTNLCLAEGRASAEGEKKGEPCELMLKEFPGLAQFNKGLKASFDSGLSRVGLDDYLSLSLAGARGRISFSDGCFYGRKARPDQERFTAILDGQAGTRGAKLKLGFRRAWLLDDIKLEYDQKYSGEGKLGCRFSKHWEFDTFLEKMGRKSGFWPKIGGVF